MKRTHSLFEQIMKNIVVIGSSNTDMVIKTTTLPRPGETVTGGEFILAAGASEAFLSEDALR